MLHIDHINALNRFAKAHGRGWRAKVLHSWTHSETLEHLSQYDNSVVRHLQAIAGPDFLAHFKPQDQEFSRIGYLAKDEKERCSSVKAGFSLRIVTAWRINNADGVDLVQPWDDTKSDARATAKVLNIYLVEPKL